MSKTNKDALLDFIALVYKHLDCCSSKATCADGDGNQRKQNGVQFAKITRSRRRWHQSRPGSFSGSDWSFFLPLFIYSWQRDIGVYVTGDMWRELS